MHKRSSRFARKTLLTLSAAATFALSIAPGIQAAGRHGDGRGHADSGPGHATAIGQPGHRAKATRLIEIVMSENQFTPNRISVRRGETVRFVLRNTDDSFHEFNIGTAVTHVAHRKEMLTMVENGVIEIDRVDHAGTKMGAGGGATMMHDDPNGKLLEPGSSAEIVWKFDAEARLEFACNVPGHYERGMKGEIRIR